MFGKNFKLCQCLWCLIQCQRSLDVWWLSLVRNLTYKVPHTYANSSFLVILVIYIFGVYLNLELNILKRIKLTAWKSVFIRSFSCPCFPAFGLNTDICKSPSPNAGKCGQEKLRIRSLFMKWLFLLETLIFPVIQHGKEKRRRKLTIGF